MRWRWGSEAVFHVECRRSARGWGYHAYRAVAVAATLGLLAALVLSVPAAARFEVWPRLMRYAYGVVVIVEMALAIGLAPALTAGAVCEERRRCRLEELLVTDLDAREIVFGKFTAGLAGLAMVVGVLVPLLIMTAILGGLGPGEVVAASIVILGVAAVGSALALLLSIWARRSFESMATATLTLLALGLVAKTWAKCVGPPPLLIRATDVWAILLDPALKGFSIEWFVFVAGALATTAGLAAVAGWRLRPDGLRWKQFSGSVRRGRTRTRTLPSFAKGLVRLSLPIPGGRRTMPFLPAEGEGFATGDASAAPAIVRLAARLRDRFDCSMGRRLGMPEPTLDAAPVLWRAWRRGDSAWMSGVWLVYQVAAIGSAILYLDHWQEAMVNGYLVSAGLLLVGVSAATAWEDERGQGGFIPLLTTPLSSREIVRGKWWGAYRAVPSLAVLPTLIVLLRGLFWGQPLVALPMAAAAGALILAYGAVATGLGLLIGLREPRTGRAIAWTLAILLVANDAWPWFWSQVMGIHIIGADRWIYLPLAWVSPWMGTYLTTAWVFFLKREPELYRYVAAVPVWAVLLATIGWALRRSIERSFDRVTGRMPEGPDGENGFGAHSRSATDRRASDLASSTGSVMLRLGAEAWTATKLLGANGYLSPNSHQFSSATQRITHGAALVNAIAWIDDGEWPGWRIGLRGDTT
jgi:ABC-type transport system involved in multi-copper enzyme maturation permease subunit